VPTKRKDNVLTTLRAMPFGVRTFLAVLAVLPFASLLVCAPTTSTTLGEAWSHLGWIDLAALWLLPLGVVAATLRRSRATIPLFLFEAVAILAFSFRHVPEHGLFFGFLRILALMVIAAGGVFVLSKDFLLPLLAQDRRWRRDRRMPVERLVQAATGTSATLRPAVLKNVSASGFCLSGFKRDGLAEDRELRRGDAIPLKLVVDDEEFALETTLMWQRLYRSDYVAGFAVPDAAAMQALRAKLTEDASAHGVHDRALRYLTRTEVKRRLVLLWASSMLLAVLQPSCGQFDADLDARDGGGVQSFETARVEVSMTGAEGTGLALASPDPGMLMGVAGCKSGLTLRSAVTSNLTLYKGDRGCAVRLDRFALSGETFVVQPGKTFQSAVGGVTPFLGTSGTLVMVTVQQTIGDPVGATGNQVRFSFFALKDGGNVVIDTHKNVVYVEPVTASVKEGTDAAATFRFVRVTQASSAALPIYYVMSGSAQPGYDYKPPTGLVTIPAGATQTTLQLPLLNDTVAEFDKVITLNIADDAKYYHYGVANVVLADDDAPATATGLALAYVPSQLSTSDGSHVDRWNDATSFRRDATQTTSSAQPLRSVGTMNGENEAVFDGANDLLKPPSNADVDTGGPYAQKTLTMVFTTGADVARRQILWEQGSSTRGLNLYVDRGRLYFNVWNNAKDAGAGSAWTPRYCSTPISPGLAYLATLRFDQANGKITGYLFGDVACSQSGVGTLYAHGNGIGLGGVNGSTLFHDMTTDASDANFAGRIAEVRAYNGAMSDGALVGVHKALLAAYGLDRPVVSVTATSPYAIEGLAAASTAVRVTLNRPIATDLTVPLTIAGTAAPGADYAPLPTSVTIPAYATEVQLAIAPVDDAIAEAPKTIVVAAAASAAYVRGNTPATITLGDDDRFAPLGGNFLWLDAAREVALDGSGRVTAWGDLSGTGQVVKQTSGSARAVPAAVDGRTAIVFDGANDRFLVSDSDEVDKADFYEGKTMALALKTGADVRSTQLLWEQGNPKRGLNVYLDEGRVYFNAWNLADDDAGATTPWGIASVSAPVAVNRRYVFMLELDANGRTLTGYVNGVAVGTATGPGRLYQHASAGLAYSHAKSLLADGSEMRQGAFFGGALFEVLGYDAVLDANLRAQLNAYFAGKYAP
jgi:hypothetical protein